MGLDVHHLPTLREEGAPMTRSEGRRFADVHPSLAKEIRRQWRAEGTMSDYPDRWTGRGRAMAARLRRLLR